MSLVAEQDTEDDCLHGYAVDLMYAKYPWLSLLGGTIDDHLTLDEAAALFDLDPAFTVT